MIILEKFNIVLDYIEENILEELDQVKSKNPICYSKSFLEENFKYI